MKKAIATIENGNHEVMTLYFNGIGEEMTAEVGDLVEEIGCAPESMPEAVDFVDASYNWAGDWNLQWLLTADEMDAIEDERAMKSEVSSILTKDGREAVEDGTLSMTEVVQMYKLDQVKKLSKIGTTSDTFRANYSRVPEILVDKLTPAEIAALVDAFYDCYSAGCAHGSNL